MNINTQRLSSGRHTDGQTDRQTDRHGEFWFLEPKGFDDKTNWSRHWT